MRHLGLMLACLAASLMPARAAVDHAPFDALLRQNVRNGLVDYQGFQTPAFDGYVRTLASASTEGMSNEDRLAMYVNAYNAFVIRGVLSNWPVDQVIKIRGFFDTAKYTVAGRDVTLDELENQIIRPFGDARVHAALVCGAKSCPPLRNEAYRGDKLGDQLDDQVTLWVNDRSKNRIDRGDRKLLVSMTFKWYKEDFEAAGGPAGFLRKYLKSADDQKWLAAGDYQLDYLKYDWDLNQQ